MNKEPGDYEKIYAFENLYKAHLKARRGKRDLAETIVFENNLGINLIRISEALRDGTYRIDGYYSFMVYDPKKRIIHALHYKDRVVQHCICDEVLSGIIEPKLIYDNTACRMSKGTSFAIKRLSGFLTEYYKRNGANGYFLRFDIRKFFDNIDHDILKKKLEKVVEDRRVYGLLCYFIDTYEKDHHNSRSIGIPLGNQSSQWFALYYLDSLDRLIKEKLRIKYYVRYMDDAVMICEDKEYLKVCLKKMTEHVERDLRLSFNEKTQIFPIRNGVDFLGFHFYLTDTGKVVRKLRTQNKKKFKRRMKKLKLEYANNEKNEGEIKQILCSYKGHMKQGHTYHLLHDTLKKNGFEE
ncbi:MAG: group II intron reverse transcriptase domain-containing protein [Lachnospiraceae bacterium]|nr:group II intron reverse transcriptase domain-containing protein [Lachnospiraceae bacterium]